MIEFQVPPELSDEEALGLIGSRPSQPGNNSRLKKGGGPVKAGKWKEELMPDSDIQVLQLNDEEEEDPMNSLGMDPFNGGGAVTAGDKSSSKVVLSKQELRSLDPTEVIICKWPAPLRYKFYKNLMPEIMSISTCHKCFKVSLLEGKRIMI